jgi:hypothetical protein
VEISRNVTVGNSTIQRQDEVGDIGDIPLMPIVLAWQHGEWQTDFFFTIYAPAGQYNAGFLANTSKNYWTYEPTIALQYYSAKSLVSFTLTTGADFNDKNNDTDYDSGDSIHAEVSFAKFFARDKGTRFGVGLNGTYYEQYGDDKGSGAILGDFKGRTVALGPTLTWAMKDAWQNMMVELKWLPELEVKNRTKGDVFWLKFGWVY